MNYHWNWNIFWESNPTGLGTYMDTLITGAQWTLATALTAWVIALILGSLLGTIRTLPDHPWAVRLANGYVELFRNIPLVVQMFVWFFVIPEFLPKALGDSIKAQQNMPFITAVACLAFFTSSRVAVQVTSGIQALPRGQKMAGTALGLTQAQTYRYILLPMAGRILLPPLTSEFLNIMKNSSVAFTIGVLELMYAARSMQEFSFQAFEAFTAATIIYMVLNICIIFLMRMLERALAVPGFIGNSSSQGGH